MIRPPAREPSRAVSHFFQVTSTVLNPAAKDRNLTFDKVLGVVGQRIGGTRLRGPLRAPPTPRSISEGHRDGSNDAVVIRFVGNGMFILLRAGWQRNGLLDPLERPQCSTFCGSINNSAGMID